VKKAGRRSLLASAILLILYVRMRTTVCMRGTNVAATRLERTTRACVISNLARRQCKTPLCVRAVTLVDHFGH